MNNDIIEACYFVAGVDSKGMRKLKQEFEALTTAQIHARDNLALEPSSVYYYHRRNRTGSRFEGEKDGGEIELFSGTERG